jgi:hypothetical protein
MQLVGCELKLASWTYFWETCVIRPARCRCSTTRSWNSGKNGRTAANHKELSGDWKAGRCVVKAGRHDPRTLEALSARERELCRRIFVPHSTWGGLKTSNAGASVIELLSLADTSMA